MLTPEQELVLQSLLIRTTESLAAYRREYPELQLASFHFAPDGAWIAVEHEEQEVWVDDEANETSNVKDIVIRKSPACTQILLKL